MDVSPDKINHPLIIHNNGYALLVYIDKWHAGLKSTDISHSKSRVCPIFWLSIVTSKSIDAFVQTAGIPWISLAGVDQLASLRDTRQLETPNNLQLLFLLRPQYQIKRANQVTATVMWEHKQRD